MKSVLEEAQEIIHGDREQTYGHPAKNLTHIAQQWTLYLRQKHGLPLHVEIGAEDVCYMMSDLKKVRQMNADKRDNLVDGAAYVALVERLKEPQEVAPVWAPGKYGQDTAKEPASKCVGCQQAIKRLEAQEGKPATCHLCGCTWTKPREKEGWHV